jgi:hypothetical protein
MSDEAISLKKGTLLRRCIRLTGDCFALNRARNDIPACSILTRKFQICFCRRRRVIDDSIRVGPRPSLELGDVVSKHIEIRGDRGCGCVDLWVKGLRAFEELHGEAGKDDIRPMHLRSKTRQLIDLLGTQVRLYIVPKVFDQPRNGRDNRRTEQFLAHRAHDDILILGAPEGRILTDARDP